MAAQRNQHPGADSTIGIWEVSGLFPGNAWGWGDNVGGESPAPVGITNLAAIAAGDSFSVAVRDDGTVVQWGYYSGGAPAGLSNVVSVAASATRTLALRNDGKVFVWGDPLPWYIDPSADPWGNPSIVPTNLAGVKMAAAGGGHNLAFLTTGTRGPVGDKGVVGGGNLTRAP